MSIAAINLLGTTDWATLFGGGGIKEKLNSSTSFTITTALGVNLQLTGTGFKGQSFFGYTMLSAGTITGFTLKYKGLELAAGDGYHLSASAFDNAAISYVLQGDKTALIDLFMKVEKTIAGKASDIVGNLDRLEHYGDIASVKLTDSGPHALSVTALQAKADASVLSKVVGPYALDIHNANGSWTVKGHGGNLTINDIGRRDTITGAGSHDTFVFKAHFGQATITDFHSHLTGATHDTIAVSKHDFLSFNVMMHHAAQVGANVVFTAANGDSLTIDNTTIAALHHVPTDFKFV